ncbi:putative wd repeat protein [Phaeomoniella chlamydospora]|uniref:Serine-threonine kinase receptor-associated protein n=1 Tax=Phaeomoniella chlamydospora TaxID=158046 RepID=A0A0G2GPM6_PHACM|nr:putative wd repeat protein [Phaeomoniella chlamydospora]
MLRDGVTGDWIGTFIGHKGAVWSSRIAQDASIAATGAADFSAKVWDTHTGECLHTLQHNHIVRAVAFPMQEHPQILATGGHEKRLRLFDLTRTGSSQETTNISPLQSTNGMTTPGANGAGSGSTIPASDGLEVGVGIHTATIKSVVWNRDYNVITTAAEDKMIRWWDLRAPGPISEFTTTSPIGSCELDVSGKNATDTGIISVAAGKDVYFFDGSRPGALVKTMKFPHEVASVSVNLEASRIVTGGRDDFWVRIYDWNDHDTQKELEVQKGHHGPVWSISWSPDGNLYATGSEDGTIKLWKGCKGVYGLWR